MTDVELLAFCGWMEDRGEGVGGAYGVMHVIMNRVHSSQFPNTIFSVVYEHNAFSWTRFDDPEHNKEPKADDPIYSACIQAAKYVIVGDDDPTKGALYYCNPKTIDKGGWFERQIINKPNEHPLLITIGKLAFYK